VSEDCHAVVSLIEHFYKQAQDNALVWSKTNILQLIKYIKLEDVYKMEACYFPSKTNPQVLCLQEEEHSSASTPGKDIEDEDNHKCVAVAVVLDSAGKTKKQQKIDSFMATFPQHLLKAYRKNQNSTIAQSRLFHHLTEKAAQASYRYKETC